MYKCSKCGASFLYEENLRTHERACAGGSHSIIVAGAEVDARLTREEEAFRRELEARGYRPGIVEKSMLFAREWTSRMVETFTPREVLEMPGARERAAYAVYPMGLEAARRWARAMMEGAG